MTQIIEPEQYTRRQLEEMATEEGIPDPGNRGYFSNKASLATAIMDARAAVVDPDAEPFAERRYWAIGPAPVFLTPRINHAALGRGNTITPRRGLYTARTPLEADLIEKAVVSKGLAFPEDPENQWDDAAYCESCNYRPRSARAFNRHGHACHPGA